MLPTVKAITIRIIIEWFPPLNKPFTIPPIIPYKIMEENDEQDVHDARKLSSYS